MLWTIRHQLSENISIPTTLPSNAYDVEIRFDFYSQQPVGGPYYASEEPIIDPLTESISALPTPTVLVVESEFVVQLADARELTTLTNNDVQLSTVVTDLADSSFLAGVSVEFFLILMEVMFLWARPKPMPTEQQPPGMRQVSHRVLTKS